MDRIHIFIPVYFRGRTVKKSLKSIFDTYKCHDYDVRIVIVDNKSDDELRDWLKTAVDECPDATLMLLDHNMGKGPAINHATKVHSDFDWFISCDSDILTMTPEWPRMLAKCYGIVPQAGMVSVEYVLNGNNPMPKQPKHFKLRVGGEDRVFHWGGQVAGGCFLTSASVWNHIGYRCSGVYGGVDGIFRQNVAESMGRKCGFLTGVMAEHLDDRAENEEYHQWKIDVQDKIRKMSPLAEPSDLGNDKGFWD